MANLKTGWPAVGVEPGAAKLVGVWPTAELLVVTALGGKTHRGGRALALCLRQAGASVRQLTLAGCYRLNYVTDAVSDGVCVWLDASGKTHKGRAVGHSTDASGAAVYRVCLTSKGAALVKLAGLDATPYLAPAAPAAAAKPVKPVKPATPKPVPATAPAAPVAAPVSPTVQQP